MYDQQKSKSSVTLLPDKHSAMQHIRRANLQTYIWKQCLLKDISYPNPEDYGWTVNENSLGPMWCDSPQLPPGLSRRKPSRLTHSEATDWADDESDEPLVEPPKKKQRSISAALPRESDHMSVSAGTITTGSEDFSSPSETSSSSDFVPSDSETVTDSHYTDDYE